jgi:hypothetical protein
MFRPLLAASQKETNNGKPSKRQKDLILATLMARRGVAFTDVIMASNDITFIGIQRGVSKRVEDGHP